MIKDYLIVSKKILPDYFEKVLEARILLESSRCTSVSQAVKQVGISRSTYYKYKDSIFMPSEEFGRKFTLSITLSDTPGILSQVLAILSAFQTSIITIHQDIPINHAAIVIITLDGADMTGSIDDIVAEIKKYTDIFKINLIAME